LQEGDRLHVGTEIGGDESDVADAPQACGEERGHEVEVGDAEHQESEGDVGDHDQGKEEDCRFGHCPEGVEVATTEPHADDQAAEDLGEEVQLWGVCHLEGGDDKEDDNSEHRADQGGGRCLDSQQQEGSEDCGEVQEYQQK